jgi:DNA helicase II / ATP-dependent DNA helicase PcrA
MRRYDLDRVSQTRGRGPIDWAAQLNPQQLAAVTAPDGPHLVIAGAGSGKTRTLVYRVAYLVDRGVHPRSILLLTFTNRAAREMLRRATTLLDGRCAEVAGGTFHAFANRVLRKYAEELGYASSYTILDASDSEDLLGRLRASLGLAERKRRFPKKDTIQRVLSKAVNTGQSIEQVVLADYSHYAKDVPDLERLAEA